MDIKNEYKYAQKVEQGLVDKYGSKLVRTIEIALLVFIAYKLLA